MGCLPTSESAMPITTNRFFYAEWNGGSVLEKLELSKLLSDRIM